MERAASKRWKASNPEKRKAGQRRAQARSAARLWDEFFAHYGHVCSCCGESDRRFLTMEHLNGAPQHTKGANGRGNKRKTGPLAIKEAKQAGWPDDITVLCFSCNCGKSRNGGVCPHKDKREDRTFVEIVEARIAAGHYGGPA